MYFEEYSIKRVHSDDWMRVQLVNACHTSMRIGI